jgi:hypothetical protein
LAKDGNVHLLADLKVILNRWKNYFCQLFNVGLHGGNGVGKREMHRDEPLVNTRSCFEFEIEVEMLKSNRCSGVDQIMTEIFQAECKPLHSITRKHIHLIRSKKKFPKQWKGTDKLDYSVYCQI